MNVLRPLTCSLVSKKIRMLSCYILLRSVTDYYINRESTLNLAFLDMTKAFDKVNHNILFNKLMQRKCSGAVVRTLYNWYSSSCALVKWDSCYTLVHLYYDAECDKVEFCLQYYLLFMSMTL